MSRTDGSSTAYPVYLPDITACLVNISDIFLQGVRWFYRMSGKITRHFSTFACQSRSTLQKCHMWSICKALSLVGCVLNDIFMSPQIIFSLKYALVADVFAEKVGKSLTLSEI